MNLEGFTRAEIENAYQEVSACVHSLYDMHFRLQRANSLLSGIEGLGLAGLEYAADEIGKQIEPLQKVESMLEEILAPYRLHEIRQDPIEDSPQYKEIEKALEEKISQRFGEERLMGSCHGYWKAKKEILREDYGIDWHSPTELNPEITFD